MITFLLILGLIISLGINVAAYILVNKLLKKIDLYEEWILEFKQDVIDTLSAMRAIDKQGMFATAVSDKGVFESDDQVGQTFKELAGLIEKLNTKIEITPYEETEKGYKP